MLGYDGAMRWTRAFLVLALAACRTGAGGEPAPAAPLDQPPNTWVKRSVGPELGYEAAMAWDSWNHRLIRIKSHQLGGGWQQAEAWLYDPAANRWTLAAPDLEPPGNCRQQQHVFDPEHGRYFRFTGTSGDHGWQWMREVYANEASVWSFDPGANRWHNMRPMPEPAVGPQRAAAWDSDHGVIVVFGGVRGGDGTNVYDPHANTWTMMNPSDEPAGRVGCNFSYDPVKGLHVLFGSEGSQPGTLAYDIRRNAWIDVRPQGSPPVGGPGGNEAVMAYDPVRRVHVALAMVREKGDREPAAAYNPASQPRHVETWVLDTAKNAWTRMRPAKEPDPGALRCRVLAFAPELGLAFLDVVESHPSGGGARQQQVWSYRYGSGAPVLAPQRLRVEASAAAAALSWEASPAGAAGYAIYKGTGADVPWKAAFSKAATVPASQTAWQDKDLKPGQHAFYRVRAVSADGVESAGSATGRLQPRVVEDLWATATAPGSVEVAWRAPEGCGEIAGYHVERAPVRVAAEAALRASAVEGLGAFVRLTKEPVKGTAFTDRNLDLSKASPVAATMAPKRYRKAPPPGKAEYGLAVYAYRVRAVNALGLESGPSPYVLTIPEPVRMLQSREEGGGVRLRWAASPGAGVRGYHVYRTDGINAGCSRITQAPLGEASYLDRSGNAARYYVVAVDALGQEGYPSSPVWGHRPDQGLYSKYEGDWHGARGGGGGGPPPSPRPEPEPPTPEPLPEAEPPPTEPPEVEPPPAPPEGEKPPGPEPGPAGPSGRSDPGAAELIRKAQECERKGQKIGARSWYSQAIKRFPGTPEALEARQALGRMDAKAKGR